MSFFETLFYIAVFPVFLALFFPGNSGAGGQTKRYLNDYPYYILIDDKTKLNNLLFRFFSKAKNNKRPFINCTKIFYIILSFLQLPIAIVLDYFQLNVFELYFWILMSVCSIPYILLFTMICVLEHKEKIYTKKQHKK